MDTMERLRILLNETMTFISSGSVENDMQRLALKAGKQKGIAMAARNLSQWLCHKRSVMLQSCEDTTLFSQGFDHCGGARRFQHEASMCGGENGHMKSSPLWRIFNGTNGANNCSQFLWEWRREGFGRLVLVFLHDHIVPREQDLTQ